MGEPQQKPTLKQVLTLVDQLTIEEREELLDQLKLEELKRELQKGIDSSNRGEVYTEEEVMAHLDETKRRILERKNK